MEGYNYNIFVTRVPEYLACRYIGFYINLNFDFLITSFFFNMVDYGADYADDEEDYAEHGADYVEHGADYAG